MDTYSYVTFDTQDTMPFSVKQRPTFQDALAPIMLLQELVIWLGPPQFHSKCTLAPETRFISSCFLLHTLSCSSVHWCKLRLSFCASVVLSWHKKLPLRWMNNLPSGASFQSSSKSYLQSLCGRRSYISNRFLKWFITKVSLTSSLWLTTAVLRLQKTRLV